jgi:hypothetical protein
MVHQLHLPRKSVLRGYFEFGRKWRNWLRLENFSTKSGLTLLAVVHSFIHSFIHSLLSAVRQVHSLFQIQFSTEWDPVLPLSIFSTLSFPLGHPVTAYVFFLILLSLLISPSLFPSVTCFRRQFLLKMWPMDLRFPICIVCRIFLSTLTTCNIGVLISP